MWLYLFAAQKDFAQIANMYQLNARYRASRQHIEVVHMGTAKEYLNRYIESEREIESLQETVLRLRSLAEKRTVSYSDNPPSTTRNPNKIPDIVEQIITEEERIGRKVSELIETKKEIEEMIEKVKDERYRTLLRMKYIGGKGFPYISAKMGYSYEHVIQVLHNRALQEIEKLLNKDTNKYY